ncbi:MAG: helix-turn-helix domain-containing protein [Faecalibacterium sp.]|nr:helix-turn-helix domain-containing protein [Faecalibacterium sp.]
MYEQIDKYRQIKGIRSVNQLAKMAKIPYTCIAELKSGRTKSLSLDKIQRLAAVFEISVDELCGNEPTISDTKKEPPALDSSNEQIVQILNIIEDLPVEKLDSVLDYLRFLNQSDT